MTASPDTDDRPRYRSGRNDALADARATGDALDAALAELGAVEARALGWLVRRAGGADAATDEEFQAWLDADPAHRAAFDDMADVWRGIDGIPADGVARLKAGLPEAEAGPTGVPPVPASRRRRRTGHTGFPGALLGWLRGLGRWAPHALAPCVAFALIGGGWLAQDLWRARPVFVQHYATARGQQIDARLPDGSTLRLDTQSRADVTLYRQRREVRLPEGQIMFTVRGDEARPFDVLAGATRITVVGTRFSVRYTPSLGSHQVQVAVEEGRVRVARADAGRRAGDLVPATPTDDAIDLAAGQTIAVDREGRLGPVGQVAAAGIAPWRGQRVEFHDMPLATAVAELERYGSTGLLVRDPGVAALRVTGSVDLRHIGDFVRSLPHVLPVRLEPREGLAEVVSRRP